MIKLRQLEGHGYILSQFSLLGLASHGFFFDSVLIVTELLVEEI